MPADPVPENSVTADSVTKGDGMPVIKRWAMGLGPDGQVCSPRHPACARRVDVVDEAFIVRLTTEARWAIGWVLGLIEDERIDDLDPDDEYVKRLRDLGDALDAR